MTAAPPLAPAASRPARNGHLPTKPRTPTDENVDPVVATGTSTSRPPSGPVLHRPNPGPTPTHVLRSTQSRLPEPTCSTLSSSGGAELQAKGRREEGGDGDQSAWDSDFEEEGVTIRPRNLVDAASSRQTSLPNRSATLQVNGVSHRPFRTTNPRSLADLEEGEGEVDYSDLVQDEKDADVLQSRIKEYQVRALFSPFLLSSERTESQKRPPLIDQLVRVVGARRTCRPALAFDRSSSVLQISSDLCLINYSVGTRGPDWTRSRRKNMRRRIGRMSWSMDLEEPVRVSLL